MRPKPARQAWRDGQRITDSVVPVGPRPSQRTGPKLLVGTVGPKTLRSAAQWADGLAGFGKEVLGHGCGSFGTITGKEWFCQAAKIILLFI